LIRKFVVLLRRMDGRIRSVLEGIHLAQCQTYSADCCRGRDDQWWSSLPRQERM